MFVCLCNAITDREFRRHCDSGAASVSDVYEACGVTPKCGKCVSIVCEMFQASKAAASRLALDTLAGQAAM